MVGQVETLIEPDDSHIRHTGYSASHNLPEHSEPIGDVGHRHPGCILNAAAARHPAALSGQWHVRTLLTATGPDPSDYRGRMRIAEEILLLLVDDRTGRF